MHPLPCFRINIFSTCFSRPRMRDAQTSCAWQQHWRVKQPPLLSSSLTARLLGKHCWSLTAVCSLAPFSMLLSLRYLQVLRMCSAHLSIRGNRAVSEQMEHTPCEEASSDGNTNKCMTLKMSEALLGAVIWQRGSSGWGSLFTVVHSWQMNWVL